MDYDYIANHINRIEGRFKNNPAWQQDSMWRIASNANLFPLNSDKLSPEQVSQVNAFIDKFKNSENGKQALESYRKWSK